MAVVWQKIGERSARATGFAATDVEPTLASDGVDILGLQSVSITIECDPGESFATASGQLDAYWYDPLVGAWSYVADAYKSIPPEAAGRRRITVVAAVPNSRGRIAFIPNGLSISAGTLTTVYAPVVSFNPGRAI